MGRPLIASTGARAMSVEASEIRDGRTMNHMDPEGKRVHARLEAWARWSRDASLRALPAVSVIGRMMEYGALGAAQAGRPPISIPEEIALVDAAVARLESLDQRVLKAYYLHWETIETSAHRVHRSVRQLQSLLKRARWRLAIYHGI